MIYLDNAATSWPKPEQVYVAMDQALREGGNAGRGGNAKSLAASRGLLETRLLLARLFHIPTPERIAFTQNVTEALNLALKGFLQQGDHVIISSFEHNSVFRVLEFMRRTIDLTYTIVDCLGLSDEQLIEEFRRTINSSTRMIATTHASNVTGTILPIAKIGTLAKEYGLTYLVDSAQTAGILPIDVEEMNIDILAFTGHKGLLGPQGTGGLYVKKGITLNPLLHGGTGSRSALLIQPQEYPEMLESGTRNIPGIIGLGVGVQYCLEHMESMRDHETTLVTKILHYMDRNPRIEYYGPRDAEHRVGLISFNLHHKPADEVGYILEQQFGIATRVGLHCAPLAHKSIGTLEPGAVRVSVGPFTTEEEVEQLLRALEVILS
ncbi:cysteine desulfurase [Desulfuribacillus stibiiarsenatis]|uniref:cysteine desulfurase n=1 Tax=Desulfuribacillus stibiiarsenatis TaxID=1390249 RepID=A0A1E5L4C2_9FIRM|nr:aminotransferase class V-fold PLP-dependent enzyme [Desulfuribacillus stibiiarsenatis]OEH84967.1 cysteine desulfurase [Desulfuribacillus stibiiarsenatis]